MAAKCRRTIAYALFLVPALLSAGEAVEIFGLRWSVPVPADWKVENIDGVPTLNLLVPRPSTQPRRPTQFAIADTPDYLSFTLDAEVRKEPKALRNRKNSLIFVYAYRDPNHFNYVHLSDDNTNPEAHNGVFHVLGGDRVRISSFEGPPTLTEEKWYKVRMVYDGREGKVEMFVDGQTSPALRAVEMSLTSGKVGIGSFFDTGKFRNVKIHGKR